MKIYELLETKDVFVKLRNDMVSNLTDEQKEKIDIQVRITIIEVSAANFLLLVIEKGNSL